MFRILVTISNFFQKVAKFKYLLRKVTFLNGIRDGVECRKISGGTLYNKRKYSIFHYFFTKVKNRRGQTGPDYVAVGDHDYKNLKIYLMF